MNLAIRKSLDSIRYKYFSLRHRYCDNFIFIHINKTGGSSVEKALQLPLDHKTAKEKIEKIGLESWRSKFSFAVIRNPWDKVVSHYHYRVQTNQTGLADNPVPFKEWVDLAYGRQDPDFFDNPKMFMPSADWISDDNGNILVDHVIRFENFEREFKEVCGKLGKNVELPHVKSSKHAHFTEYYDDYTRQIVSARFSRDIEMFGYEFL